MQLSTSTLKKRFRINSIEGFKMYQLHGVKHLLIIIFTDDVFCFKFNEITRKVIFPRIWKAVC